MAQDYFPLTKKEAIQKGYSWYDRPAASYGITCTSDQLPQTISETKDDILTQTIQCKTQEDEAEKNTNPLCVSAFRLIPLELTLYRKLGVPVPEYCFPCRRTRRFAFRNPRALWQRSCMCGAPGTNGEYQNTAKHYHGLESCSNTFETSYAPDRPEIIYCESCYQSEIA